MPASGPSHHPPPLTGYLSWEQIKEYNEDRVRVGMPAVVVDPEAQDVNVDRQQPAGSQPNA